MRTYTVTEYDMEDYNAAKQNMTNKEVLSCLQSVERSWLPDWNFSGTEDDFEYYKLHIALYKAMDIIESQMKAESN